MRIENNNNVSFGAYFKNNQMFKEVYKKDFRRVRSDLLDSFVKKCPNHEIEILPEVTKSPFTNGKVYTVFNNMTGGIHPIDVKEDEYILNKLMDKLIDLTTLDSAVFWGKEPHDMIDNFKALTGIK